MGESCLYMSNFSTKSPKIISRVFGDEVIVANCENGLYYSLIGTAADIWKGIEAGHSAASIAEGFSSGASGDEGVAAIVEAFVASLLAEELIAISDDKETPSDCTPALTSSFVPPAFDRHDDLRELLMLDPVHEVSEEGWPHRKDELSEPV